jgi:hypothetical protein
MGFSDMLAAADVAATGILGDSVTYTPTVGDAVTVDGIFDAAYVRVDPGLAGISSSGPAVFLRLADLGALDPVSDLTATVTVDGDEYTIHETKPDGLGGCLLLLHLT